MNISEAILSIRYKKTIEKLNVFLMNNCSTERREHIMRVSETCQTLAPRFGVSVTRAKLVGMAHDMVREWSDEQYLSLVASAGYAPNEMEIEKPLLLHGRCAALLLRRDYGVRNQSMLRALEDHTLGRAGMDMLGILLYVSDYIEPGRRYTTEEFRRQVMALPPWEMVLAINEHAAARGKKRSAQTHELHLYARKMSGLELPGMTDSTEGVVGV